MKQAIVLILSLVPLGVCAASPAPDEVVRQFVDAFNRRDMAALAHLAHPDIEWLSVAGARLSIETEGRENLSASLSAYFESCPTCRSGIEISSVNGPYVAAVETASWESNGGARTQRSTSVYEVAGDWIRRVWYFPSVGDP